MHRFQFTTLFLSIVSLLMTVQDYWDYKFRGVHDLGHSTLNLTRCDSHLFNYEVTTECIEQKVLTPLQIQWNSYLSIASTIPQVMVLLVNAVWGHKLSTRFKILSSLGGIIILFTLTDILTQVNTDNFQKGFLILTLTTAVLISCFIALLQVFD